MRRPTRDPGFTPQALHAGTLHFFRIVKDQTAFQSKDQNQTRRGRAWFYSLSGAVVEVNGIEPMTSCLQSRRSPN
jgi:hypothetical protein